MKAMQQAMAGQSYTINGVTYNRQNLDALQRYMDWLDKQLSRETAAATGMSGSEIAVRI